MQLKYSILIATIGAVLLWSSGCRKPFGISGNNQVTTETRQMVSFNRIVNEGSFNVYITQDSIYQVIVEAEGYHTFSKELYFDAVVGFGSTIEEFRLVPMQDIVSNE